MSEWVAWPLLLIGLPLGFLLAIPWVGRACVKIGDWYERYFEWVQRR